MIIDVWKHERLHVDTSSCLLVRFIAFKFSKENVTLIPISWADYFHLWYSIMERTICLHSCIELNQNYKAEGKPRGRKIMLVEWNKRKQTN